MLSNSPLSASDINAMNAHARSLELSKDELSEIARRAGVTLGTARRWFAHGATVRNLVKRTAIGLTPKQLELSLGREDAFRACLGLLVYDGLQQESALTGESQFSTIETLTLSDAGILLVDVLRGRRSSGQYFLGSAFTSITLDGFYLDRWVLIVMYNKIGEGQGYGDFYTPEIDDEEAEEEYDDEGDY